MHSYHSIYDFGNDSTAGCWWPAAVLLAVSLGIASLGIIRRTRLTVPAAVALLAAAGVAAMPCWEKRHLMAVLRDGQVKIAEGALRGYWNRPAESALGGTPEWVLWENFTVAGVLFGYYRGQPLPGFSNAGPESVEFKDGMQVRIAYFDGLSGDSKQRRILKLEIADSVLSRPQTPDQ